MTKWFLAALVLIASGCSSDVVNSEVSSIEAPVTIKVNTFSVSHEDLPAATRTETIADYASLKALTLAFYKDDGTEQFKTTQFRSDATTYTTFGEISTTLPLGSYTLVVIGYGQGGSNHAVTLTSPTEAGFDDYARETFTATQTVDVTSKRPISLTATLQRIITKVSLVSTDGRVSTAQSVRITFSGGSKSFNPTTGLATDDSGFANTVDVTGVTAGNTSNIANALFLATDEETMNISIETLDADDHVICTTTVPSVPLKRNRVTTLTGPVYSASTPTTVGSFQVDTAWLPGNDIEF